MSAQTVPPLVQLDHVSYAYPEHDDLALADLEWSIDEGSFVLVVGRSGSGKSTLLRCLNGLVPHFSGGRFGGVATIAGQDTRRTAPRHLSQQVGFVAQDPESQLITNRVEDELAFGMEQCAVPPITMRKRVEEVLDLLGIAHLRHRDPATLSGGERQRVVIAATLALQPDLLVLDEPTSQLDPWGAEEVLTALHRLNDDLGLTIVLAEHRLERIAAHADRFFVLGPPGTASLDGPPRQVLAQMPLEMLPPLVRLARLRHWQPLPVTIKEGRRAVANDQPLPPLPPDSPAPTGTPILTMRGVHSRYGAQPVLRGLDLEIRPGELVALMGRNGSGKTSLLRALFGFHRVNQGQILVDGRDVSRTATTELAESIGYLPQEANALLFASTVADELDFSIRHSRGPTADRHILLSRLHLDRALDRNPRDLSGGEKERAAMAAVLIRQPKLLLLDEPTRGMDYHRKRELGSLLHSLRAEGTAIVMATHDVELVAQIATRVVLLGEGVIVADGSPRSTLSGSLTFATQINKLYGDRYLTVADVTNEDSGA